MDYEWDLTRYYDGPNDPRIFQDLDSALRRAEDLAKNYPASNLYEPANLMKLIEDCEKILANGLGAYIFSELYLVSHADSWEAVNLFENVKRKWLKIRECLMDMEALISRMGHSILRTVEAHEGLKPFRFAFQRALAFGPHLVSRSEDKIKWKALLEAREQLLGRYRQLILEDGAEGLGLEGDKALENRARVLSAVLDDLVENRIQENGLRSFTTPLHKMWLLNGMEPGQIQEWLGVVKENYPLAQRYFRWKARRLGQERLQAAHIQRPLTRGAWPMDANQALEFIKKIVGHLNPTFSRLIEQMVEMKCLDLAPRPGKIRGAICKALVPTIPPHILLSFRGGLKDTAILAHEVGHGIHYSLCSSKSCLNFRPAPLLEETAAIFFEILILHYLSNEGRGDLAATILLDDLMKILFRQSVITEFELNLYEKRKAASLEMEAISSIWLEKNKELYGDTVDLTPPYRYSWALVPHLFEKPMYCSNYVVASLVALNLLEMALEIPEEFSVNFLELLEAGSSKPAPELLSAAGVDVGDDSFIESAFQVVARLLDAVGA